MKQIHVFLPNYTADVSGVCSALYELGGMTVIHDPSGCNSTYNTHDEPRWVQKDSLVFISGLTQMDAVLGNDAKLIEDVLYTAAELKPAFIALVRTPVPLMTGTDFEGIAAEIRSRSGIPVFTFPTTGMSSYIRGAGMAFETLAGWISERTSGEMSRQTGDKNREGISVNILGATPLDLSVGTTLASLKDWVRSRGFILQTCLTMDSSLEEISRAGQADISLVITAAGLPAARVLSDRLGIPYVTGFPAAGYGEDLEMEIRETLSGIRTGKGSGGGSAAALEGSASCRCAHREERSDYRQTVRSEPDPDVFLIGEPVISLSLARAIYREKGILPTVLSPLETDDEIIRWGEGTLNGESAEKGRESCIREISGEDELRKALAGAGTVIADPMYRPVCPPGCSLLPLPHEAFSGRIYRKQIPDLVRFFETWAGAGEKGWLKL